MKEIKIEDLNRLMRVDGKNVTAMDVLDSVPKETLIITLAYIFNVLKFNQEVNERINT